MCLIKTGVNFRKISVEKMRATLKKMVAPKNCVLRILRGDLDSAEGEIARRPRVFPTLNPSLFQILFGALDFNTVLGQVRLDCYEVSALRAYETKKGGKAKSETCRFLFEF